MTLNNAAAALPLDGEVLREHPLIGQLVAGTYRVNGVLDYGGMGVVLDAEHVRLMRPVAIKVLDRRYSSDPGCLARFEREIAILSQVRHPHVVSVLDRGTLPFGQPFLVMEQLEGTTLARRLEREGRLALWDTVEIVDQVASGLAAVHHASVVHRDLKPENVFILDGPAASGFVKLLDFGIGTQLSAPTGRITDAFQVMGTPLYMSPEQALARHDLVDARSDQFALAVIAFEMLAGSPPFDGETLVQLLCRVIDARAPRLSDAAGPWARPLDDVLARALQKERHDRFPSVLAFAEALAAAADQVRPSSWHHQQTLPAPPPPPTPPPPDEEPAESTFALYRAVDEAYRAHRRGDAEEATRRVLGALEIADSDQGSVIVRVGNELFERILLDRLGGESSTLELRRMPMRSEGLSPELAYIASISNAITLEDVLAASALGRLQSLRAVAILADRGIVALHA